MNQAAQTIREVHPKCPLASLTNRLALSAVCVLCGSGTLEAEVVDEPPFVL